MCGKGGEETMAKIFTYKEESLDFFSYIKRAKLDHPDSVDIVDAKSWLYEYDESTLTETERLNIVLCVLKWGAENNCLDDWLSDELYLYYEDFVNGKLDDVIDPEERDDVVRDLTAAFNKAFPNGLEE